jgi:hypothetical protein
MALAEVGITVRPSVSPSDLFEGYWQPSITILRPTRQEKAMVRKAWALVAVSEQPDGTMACFKHGHHTLTHLCLGVYAKDVLANPYIECGAP